VIFKVLTACRSSSTTWLLGGLILAVALSGCAPAQVLEDPETFKTVDALWTAVTARSTDLLNQADKELDKLAAAGKLSTAGRTELRAISDTAHSGKWDSAISSLRSFIRGQRPPKKKQK